MWKFLSDQNTEDVATLSQCLDMDPNSRLQGHWVSQGCSSPGPGNNMAAPASPLRAPGRHATAASTALACTARVFLGMGSFIKHWCGRAHCTFCWVPDGFYAVISDSLDLMEKALTDTLSEQALDRICSRADYHIGVKLDFLGVTLE